jgi:hypothetical protein
MKKLFLFPLLVSIILSNAQTTAIPDANFEAALIFWGYDSGPIDGSVLTANINTVTSLMLDFRSINDLTGIQDFTLLDVLHATGNFLTTIDVSQNSNLTALFCGNNQLTSLYLNDSLKWLICSDNQLLTIDVTMCKKLEILTMVNNGITSLDLSQNTYLRDLACENNFLTELNLTYSDSLSSLDCDSNLLTCLNVKNGNNTFIWLMSTVGNPSLLCLEVDNVAFSSTNWILPFFTIDAASSFSTNCGNPCSTFGVGIEELTSATIKTHPNPTSGQLTISLEEAKTGVLRVLNSLGQVVLEDTFEATKELDISLDGPSGLYFLQLEVDGQMITKKVVKK